MKATIMTAGQDLSEEDFMVKTIIYTYGKGAENPIGSVFFYKKGTHECTKMNVPDEVSHFLQSVVFQEEIIRVYLKTSDKETALRQAIARAPKDWHR